MGRTDELARDAVCEGWDSTPGIVSVWADWDGSATVWRRSAPTGALVQEEARFRPWVLTDDLRSALALRASSSTPMSYRELTGEGALRYLVHADDGRVLRALRERGKEHVLLLPPEEQYLVASGRTYFRDMLFDQLQRLQFDLETTGLDASRDRIFLVAVRHPSGRTETLEARGVTDEDEADLIRRLAAVVRDADPDVIENHNLHGFDLPFLAHRARVLGVPLALGRLSAADCAVARPAAASPAIADGPHRVRFVAPGRELIDTMDAVLRYGFSTGDLPGAG